MQPRIHGRAHTFGGGGDEVDLHERARALLRVHSERDQIAGCRLRRPDERRGRKYDGCDHAATSRLALTTYWAAAASASPSANQNSQSGHSVACPVTVRIPTER